MFGGGGGLDPRKMEQMMKQMGIEASDIDAEEVVIRTAEHDLVFDAPNVTRMDARGQETYQIVGSPDERERGDAAEEGADAAATVDEGDVEIVADRTGVSEDEAREALENNDGDLAAAVAELE